MKKSQQFKKKHSKKHHYLPRYYLKGFTDSKNCFFVYDKKTDRIIPPTTPDAAFFENNLNTVILPNGNTTDFLEDLYKFMENHFWKTLDKIRESTRETPFELLDKMHLFLFLLFLHWRLPSNINLVKQLSEKFFLDNNEFDYFKLKNKSGGKTPEVVINVIKNSSAFKKTAKFYVPFAPFFKDKDWVASLENWRFFYTGDENSWYLVGDNPIVTKGIYDHDPINCLKEFVFPVSGKILLVNINKPISSVFPPKFVIQYNVSIIERAQRFVACQNKDFLQALTKYYKVYVQFGKTNTIITKMFNMLEGKDD